MAKRLNLIWVAVRASLSSWHRRQGWRKTIIDGNQGRHSSERRHEIGGGFMNYINQGETYRATGPSLNLIDINMLDLYTSPGEIKQSSRRRNPKNTFGVLVGVASVLHSHFLRFWFELCRKQEEAATVKEKIDMIGGSTSRCSQKIFFRRHAKINQSSFGLVQDAR